MKILLILLLIHKIGRVRTIFSKINGHITLGLEVTKRILYLKISLRR
jgi:hypothetical protein